MKVSGSSGAYGNSFPGPDLSAYKCDCDPVPALTMPTLPFSYYSQRPALQKLFKQILTSRVYEAAIETSLDRQQACRHDLNNRILLKREDQQPVFSFKLRGAYNKIAHLTAARAGKRGDHRLSRKSCPGGGLCRQQNSGSGR